MHRHLTSAFAPILLLGLVHGQEGIDPAALVFQGEGFRIARPDEAWTFHATTTPDGGSKLDVFLKDAGGTVASSIQVATAGAEETPARLLQAAKDRVRGRQEYAEPREDRADVAGTDAPGLSVRYTDKGGRHWRIVQHYVVADGTRFVLQAHAPAAEFATQEAAFATIRASLTLIEVPAAIKTARRTEAMATRCGSEVRWAKDWNDAAARAKAEGRLILVVARAYAGFALSDGLAIHTFMDPDVLDLVGERLVPMRWTKGVPAPFVADAAYGLSGSTFGQALLLVDGEGQVLAETAAAQPLPAYDSLREALARHEPAIPTLPGTPLERAVRHARRGEFAAAEALLGDAQSADAGLIRASLARKQRDGRSALTALGSARVADSDGELAARIDLDEAVVLLRLDRRDDAVRVLDAVLARKHAPERPAAMYWRGVCDARPRDQDATRARCCRRSATTGPGSVRPSWAAVGP